MAAAVYFCCLLPLLVPVPGVPSLDLPSQSPVAGLIREVDSCTAQEHLLAELLAKLPEAERAGMIARALVAARQTESLSAKPRELQDLPNLSLADLQHGQAVLAVELSRLQVETERLRKTIDQLSSQLSSRESPGRPLSEPKLRGQTFVLPAYRLPSVPIIPGPAVNQPSGAELVWQPPQESPAAADSELLQLQQTLNELNQRLQRLQGGIHPPPRSGAAAAANEPGAAGQAARPSPLLPR